jgi:beta-galactosidase
MKKVILLLLIVYAFVTTNAQRTSQTINECWRFERSNVIGAQDTTFNDKDWGVVNLPHTWNAEDALKVSNYYQGIGWYRKTIFSPIPEDKKYNLFFEGANQETTVYVNGKEAGTHKGGYTAFRFDITSLLNKGKNVVNYIAVKVDNSINPSIAPVAFSADFNFWGGIYRDVYLEECNLLHFRTDNYGSKGVFVETPEVTNDAASVKVRGEIKNEGKKTLSVKIKTIIADADNKTVKEAISKLKVEPGENTPFEILTGKISFPKLWSPDSPYLYRVYTQIIDAKTGKVIDDVDNSLGFRWFSADTKNGFMLNGKPLKLLGASRHQDYEGLGNALSNDLNRYDIELLKKMGANYIRIAHYPQDPSVIDACDKLGLIAWEEIPILNAITPTEEFFTNCRNNLTEMIRQNFNHPAIMIWAYSNEVLVSGYSDSLGILHKELEKICRTEDHYRLTALAFHGSPLYNRSHLADIPMIIGWNRYDGWYRGKVEDFGKFLDEENKKYPNRPLIISEYGAGSDTRIHSLKPEAYDFSTEYQQLFHASYLKQILARPYVIGSSIWNFCDFGVSKRGEAMPGINNKGIVRYNREPKDIYYFYQAALMKTPVLYIASRDWTGRIGIPANANEKFVKQPVKVFSNLSEVELILNGKSLGKHAVTDFSVVYDVPFEDGKNILEVKSGNQRDVLIVDFKVQPYDLRTSTDKNLVIAVNAGSNCYFTDPTNRVTYEPDQSYREGSWGYIGADLSNPRKDSFYGATKITGTDIDPLFQNIRIGMEAYKFDVPNGRYEVELFFSEVQDDAANARVFNVSINKNMVIPEFDLFKQCGASNAVIKTFAIEVRDGKGIMIGFSPIKGIPIISGLKITKL